MQIARTNDRRRQADREKRLVAGSSLAAALALTLLKLVVGLATNSLGILSEAAHSALDLVAAGVTLWAVRVSGRPADLDHTYGHGKVENLSALFETLLLLATCTWIVYEAVRRVFFAEHVGVDPSLWAFLVMIVSIVIDFSRSRALRRVAEKYQSQALEADALHFSTDILSSGVVLAGLVCVLAAQRFNVPWLEKADALAALGVAMIVIWISLRLGRRSVDDLLDKIPAGLGARISAAAAEVPGVERVKQVRVRKSGPEVFADVTLTLDHGATLAGAHDVADAAEAAIRQVVANADVVVHVEPGASAPNDLPTTIRLLAMRYGLGAHNIRVYQEQGGTGVELHVEVQRSLRLEDAHRQATDFERALGESIPGLARVVTHIEPAGAAAARSQAQEADQARIWDAIRQFLQSHGRSVQVHDLKMHEAGEGLEVSFHCTLDPAMSITEAHRLTEKMEQHLRHGVPGLGRVMIHVEPIERQQ